MVQHSDRHHYIPCFYTKLWAGEDNKLCEYTRYRDGVKFIRRPPKGVGFHFNLYTLTGLEKERQAILEDSFFRKTDQIASDAVQFMLDYGTINMPTKLRSGFARLLTSFFHRTPDRVKEIKESLDRAMDAVVDEIQQEYANGLRSPLTHETTFEQAEQYVRSDNSTRAWGESLMRITDSVTVNSAIINMIWRLRTVNDSDISLLTSDKPLIRTNGFAHSKGHLALPLGPRILFIATNNYRLQREFRNMTDINIVENCNKFVVENAIKNVYGLDDTQLSFVERFLRP